MADDLEIVGGDLLGWMDDITDFTLPQSGYCVLHYTGAVSSSHTIERGTVETGQLDDWQYGATILKPKLLANHSMENSITVTKNKKVVAQSRDPWREKSFFSTTGGTIYDYQAGTVVAGLKGAPFGFKYAFLGVGAHTDDTFENGKNTIVDSIATEFNISFSEALQRLGLCMFLYDFMVLAGQAPVNHNPAEFDTSAQITPIKSLRENQAVWKSQVLMFTLGGVKDKGPTTTIQVRCQGTPSKFSFQGTVLNLYTYKTKPKTWEFPNVNEDGQWDFFSNVVDDPILAAGGGHHDLFQRNVSQSGNDPTQPNGFQGSVFNDPPFTDGVFSLPEPATDFRTVGNIDRGSDASFAQPTLIITFVVNNKTLKIISATRAVA